MSIPNHISFIEKITKKLADAFLQINQLCVQQMRRIENNSDQIENTVQINLPVQSYAQLPEEVENNEQSPQEEEIPKEQQKEAKTKKIKKQKNHEDNRQGQEVKNKKKIKVISHKPKAPASSFLIFNKQQKANIAKMYPNYGVKELAKVAAKCWNDLAVDQKQPYIKLGDEQRRLYQVKMQQYRIEFPHEIAQQQKLRKQMKREKEKQRRNNKESLTPKKQKPQVPERIEVQPVVETKPVNQKNQQQQILISSRQQQSEDIQQQDDSLGMV